MINLEALFGISYGLYIVSSGTKDKGNAFISNSVFQVSAEPPKFAVCCNKNNYTSDLIIETGFLAATILEINTPADIFAIFGYKSGREYNKMKGWNVNYSENGVPVILNHAISFLECNVLNKIDVGTHWLFIGDLLQTEMINHNLEPLTYQYYRQVKKGLAPKNAPTYIDTSKFKKASPSEGKAEYKCDVCGYIYNESDEDVRFADLPDDWVCPLCGAEKTSFRKI
jgi:flavin reductase (DIM6/NTAB) family NADH-FMN oxidoreductase RutF/rubredoxin